MLFGDQLVAALAVALTLLLIIGVLAVRKWWRSFRARSIARHAYNKQVDAQALLEREGYVVLGAEVRRTWSVSCDGQALPVELRADYLVRRDGRRYVADVKTGAQATKITTAATRRQLLEYQVAYEVRGVLLVDMVAERVREIGFDLPGP